MWEILLGIAAIILIGMAWAFLVPSAAFAGAAVAVVLGVYAVFSGIIRAINDSFEDKEGRMRGLYYDGKEPAKKSWFFGPCFSIFPLIFKNSFGTSAQQTSAIGSRWIALMSHGFLAKIFFAPIGAVLIGAIWVVNTILSLFYGVIFIILFLVFLVVVYILYIIFKGIDGIVLRARGLKNHCPNCNELVLVPKFVCPGCGQVHNSLTPNKYGVMNHLCQCGTYLGATYFTGKSCLHSICPKCGEPFKTGATKPLTLQLIGGTSAGKTVFLAALMSEVHRRSAEHKVPISLDPSSADNMKDLIRFATGKSSAGATQGRDVTFYAEVVNMGEGKTPLKLEVVDIPGEMFAGETALKEGIHKMSQYNYSDGFIFLVDPYSEGDLSAQHPNDGTEVSPIANEEVLNNFDQYLIAQNFAKTGQMITKPISVVVVKSDTQAIRQQLTMDMVRETYDANPAAYGNSFDKCRDEMVKQLLASIGMSSLVGNIEARFKNAHFFLSSAMGHAPKSGKAYEPDHVFETAEWIWKQANPGFLARLNGKK